MAKIYLAGCGHSWAGVVIAAANVLHQCFACKEVRPDAQAMMYRICLCSKRRERDCVWSKTTHRNDERKASLPKSSARVSCDTAHHLEDQLWSPCGSFTLGDEARSSIVIMNGMGICLWSPQDWLNRGGKRQTERRSCYWETCCVEITEDSLSISRGTSLSRTVPTAENGRCGT